MAAPDETLEALVRDELRGPIQTLVRKFVPELVAEAIRNSKRTSLNAAAAPRLYRTCGERPAEKHRTVCSRCGDLERRDRRPQSTSRGNTVRDHGAAAGGEAPAVHRDPWGCLSRAIADRVLGLPAAQSRAG